jgi:lactate dehydrogenase-like 2-hydroxyacid dehydrogenase
MNVVVVDGARLAGEVDFPMLDLPKFGWQQYPELQPEELVERCWRADIIVTVATPIDQAVIDKAFKLKLIAVAGEDASLVDTDAASARGITVVTVPGMKPDDPVGSQALCDRVVENINRFIRELEQSVQSGFK